MTANIQPPSKSLNIPDNFPVTWEDSSDASLFWTIDRVNFPAPITPMTGQLIAYSIDGYNRAVQAFEIPVRAYNRRINTYNYGAVAPLSLPVEEIAAMGQRSEANVVKAMESLSDDWANRYLPEVKEHLAFWEGFDLPAASLPALRSHLDDSIERIRRLFEIHFRLVFPFLLAPSLFEELYSDLFGHEHLLDAYRLLEGIDSKTVEADRALWQLSRQALAAPAVRQILQQTPADAAAVALGASPESQYFLECLGSYLDKYGQCSDMVGELEAPHWIEEPAPVFQRLQEYLTQPDQDLAGEMAAQAARRERFLAETRLRLAAYPQPVIDQFESLMKAARAGLFLSEEHNYWIDRRLTYQARMLMLEIGRRYVAAGKLDQAADIFYLTFDEAGAILQDFPGPDRRKVVASRRAEMAYFRTIQPPTALGAIPPGSPPEDPLSRAGNRYFGMGGPSRAANDPNVVYGNPGSPGVRRGRAKVLHSLAESGKLKPGDILVAVMTTPAWTPLFATAAAVVTDAGGVLSHCAIVAREFGIPAVVGAGSATSVIQDGQMLEVNGSEGVIRVLTPG